MSSVSRLALTVSEPHHAALGYRLVLGSDERLDLGRKGESPVHDSGIAEALEPKVQDPRRLVVLLDLLPARQSVGQTPQTGGESHPVVGTVTEHSHDG
jgi:hypothetical protein